MPAILFALISFLGWAVGDIFGTVSTRRIGGYSLTLWENILTLIIASFFLPFVLKDLNNLTPAIFLLTLGLGSLFIVTLITFYEGLRIGNASLVSTISSSFTALVVIFSMIFFKEKLSTYQILSLFPIFIGIFLSTFDFKEFRKGNLHFDKGLILAIITMLLWGIYFTFIKIPVQQIGWFLTGYIVAFAFPLIFLIAKIRNIKLQKPTFKNALVPTLAAILLLRVGDFSFNFGISQGLTSIVAPIAGSYPVLFVILAFIFFKDKITKQQILGIITTLIGIVLLSFFSI